MRLEVVLITMLGLACAPLTGASLLSYTDLPADVCSRLDPIPLRSAAQIADSPFGVQTTCMGEGHEVGRLPDFLAEIADCGYKWVKDYFGAGNVAEDEDPAAKWRSFPPHYEAYCRLATGLGMRILLRLDAPLYHGREVSTPEGLQAVRLFYAEAVRQFKPWVHDWEIDNEPNIGNEAPRMAPEQYARIAKVAAEAIHAEDPTARVYAPAAAMLQCLADTPYPYITKLLDAGLLDGTDVFSYHPYHQPYLRTNVPEHASEFYPWTLWGTYTRQLEDLRARLRAKAGREVPISATEVGYPTNKARETQIQEISLLTQAKYEQRLMIQDFALGVRPRINFIYTRPWSDPYEVEHQFNLVDPDGTKRPACLAAQSICAVFDDSLRPADVLVRCDALPSAKAQVYAFTTQRSGVDELLIAVWAAIPAQDTAERASRCRIVIPSTRYRVPLAVDLLAAAPLRGTPVPYRQLAGETIIEGIPLKDSPVLVRAFAL